MAVFDTKDKKEQVNKKDENPKINWKTVNRFHENMTIQSVLSNVIFVFMFANPVP